MVTRRTSSARATLAMLALAFLSLAAPAAPAFASDASPADAGPLGTSSGASGASVVAADASAPPPPPAPASALRRATGPGGVGSARYGGTRFTADDEAHFSDRLVAMLRKPCEAYARNVNDEPALHLQHAAVIFLRHKCARAPEPTPGQTANACSDLANAVSIDLTHEEATAMLKQLLHERCQNEAILMTNPDTQSRDAASFLVKDTVRRVAEEEQEIRDYAGIPTDREAIARRPPVGEDGMLLLGPSDDADDESPPAPPPPTPARVSAPRTAPARRDARRAAATPGRSAGRGVRILGDGTDRTRRISPGYLATRWTSRSRREWNGWC